MAGIRGSGMRYVWVARGDELNIKKNTIGDRDDDSDALVCDQLRVLCRPSIGRFWMHYGWSLTLEALFCGADFPYYLGPKFPITGKLWRIGRLGIR